MANSTTYVYDAEAEALLRDLLEARGVTLTEASHAHWQAKVVGGSITFYRSGKLLIQGKGAAEWAETLAPRNVLGSGARFDAALAKHPTGGVNVWAGSDESGKGDYFGPLVVCAARVAKDQLALLDELGVADCKTLSDQNVLDATPLLRAAIDHEVISIGPERYNQLYNTMGRNLNRLMAWAHARVLENLITAHPDIELAVVDRFTPNDRLDKALLENTQKVALIQRPRAEDDPAVAAASIIARGLFLRGLRKLGKRFGMMIPKGAGGPVLTSGRKFVATHGADDLGLVAKLHFRTTEKVLPTDLFPDH